MVWKFLGTHLYSKLIILFENHPDLDEIETESHSFREKTRYPFQPARHNFLSSFEAERLLRDYVAQKDEFLKDISGWLGAFQRFPTQYSQDASGQQKAFVLCFSNKSL